ncbi:MAG: hypoxanthine phosphoribosyltransferase [bacterium]
MKNDIKKVLVSEKQIDEITSALANQLNKDYANKEVLVIGMLKGGIPFMMDLIKKIEIQIEIDFMQTSSYHGGTESDSLVFKKDIDTNIENKHVLIVDDIVDTGKTLTLIIDMLSKRNAASIEIVTLLDKPEGRTVVLEPKYIGTTIPKEFVVGYGLDYDEKYRNLPYIGVLKEEIYK